MKNLLTTAVLTAVGTACIAGITMAATPAPNSSQLIVPNGTSSFATQYHDRTYTFYAQSRNEIYPVVLGSVSEDTNGKIVSTTSAPWPASIINNGPYQLSVLVTPGSQTQAVPNGLEPGKYCQHQQVENLDVVTFSAQTWSSQNCY